MLHEQEHVIGERSREPRFGGIALQRECVGVAEDAEFADEEGTGGHTINLVARAARDV